MIWIWFRRISLDNFPCGQFAELNSEIQKRNNFLKLGSLAAAYCEVSHSDLSQWIHCDSQFVRRSRLEVAFLGKDVDNLADEHSTEEKSSSLSLPSRIVNSSGELGQEAVRTVFFIRKISDWNGAHSFERVKVQLVCVWKVSIRKSLAKSSESPKCSESKHWAMQKKEINWKTFPSLCLSDRAPEDPGDFLPDLGSPRAGSVTSGHWQSSRTKFRSGIGKSFG